MHKNLTYRPGSISDLPQLKQLSIISYGQYSNILTAENWKKLNKALHDEQALSELISKSYLFFCESNSNNIVGMAYLLPHGNSTDIYQEDWCYIRMVGVHPDCAGQGIARRLTEMCIEKARELNEITIALHTSEFMDAARHIYESIGFTVFKEIPLRLGKTYWLYTLDISKQDKHVSKTL
jgi:ribosomal protein S18 acetylase RimI-like enzyme